MKNHINSVVIKALLRRIFPLACLMAVFQSGFAQHPLCSRPVIDNERKQHFKKANEAAPPLIRIMDPYGNEFSPQEITYDLNAASDSRSACGNSPTCVAGMFTLHFQDESTNSNYGFDECDIYSGATTLGQQRQAVACQVFKDLSVLLHDPNPSNPGRVHIWMHSDASYSASGLGAFPSGVGGLCQPFLLLPLGINNAILDNEVWKTIKGGNNSYAGLPAGYLPTNSSTGLYHGVLAINFAVGGPNYHLNLDVTTGGGLTDLYSVILHEAIHSLGFYSEIGSTGSSKLVNDVFSRYDMFLRYNNAGTQVPLITFTGPNNWAYTGGLSSLAINCSSNNFNFNGAALANQTVFTQTAWSDGTNLSHFGCVGGNPGICGPDYALPNSDFVMNPCMGTGSNYTKRRPSVNEERALCDLGYRLRVSAGNATYGDAPSLTTAAEAFILRNYTDCSGACVATGYSDAFSTPYDQNITVTNAQVLINDRDNNYALLTTTGSVNLPTLFTPNAGTVTAGAGNFTFNPDPNFTGIAVIGYYPRCSGSAVNGNLTFVFITVNTPPMPLCSNADPCNLLCHGNFETLTDLQIPGLYDFNMPGFSSNSPDIGRVSGANNCIGAICNPSSGAPPFGNGFVGCVSGWFIPAPSGAGNTTYIGIAGFSSNSENLHYRLLAPLTNTVQYQLRFIAYNPQLSGTCTPTIQLFGNNGAPFSALTLGSVVINGGAAWTTYTITFNAPAAITDIVIAPNTNSTYVLVDNFELFQTGATQLDITATPPGAVCPNGTATINYQICRAAGQPNNPSAIPLQLSVPAGFTVTAGNFNSAGQFTIPALGLTSCINLSVTYTLNPSTVQAGITYPISITATTGGCFTGSGGASPTVVNITPTANPLRLTKTASSSTVLNGTNFTFSFELCNTSSSPLTGIQFSDVVNSNISIVSVPSPLSVSSQTILGTLSLGAGSLTAPSCTTYTCTVKANYSFPGASSCGYQVAEFANTAAAQIPGTCTNAQSTVVTRVYSHKVVGSNVGIPLLSQAIAQGMLLPASSSATATQTFTVDGDFTVDQNYTLGWNGGSFSYVYCKAGSLIFVSFGQVFTTHHTYYQGCDFLWKGIVPAGVFWFLPAGTLNMSTCIVSDAQYGVRCYEGSQVGITGVEFRQCFSGIYFDGNGASASPTLTLTTPLVNNQFSCNTLLFKPPYSGMANGPNQPSAAMVNTTRMSWAGMHLDNLSAINIGNVSQPVNIFLNLANGIVTNKCSPNIVRSIFENIQPYGYTYGVQGNAIYCTADLASGASSKALYQRGMGSSSIATYTFQNCNRGIVAEEMHVDIGSNLFTGNTSLGIQISNAKYANINIGYTDGTGNNNLGNRMTSVLDQGIALLQNDPVNATNVQYNDITVVGIPNTLTGWGITVSEQLNPPVNSAYYHHNKVTLNANGSVGIQLSTCRGVPSAQFLYLHEVYNNTVLMNNPLRNLIGIGLNSCQLVSSYQNVVTSTNAATVAWLPGYPVGYWYQSHNTGRLYCNQNNIVYQGVRFNGTNTGVVFRTNDFGNAGIAGTTVNNHTGLLVDPSSAIPVQSQQGNRWYGSYTDRAARNSASSVTGMEFFCNSNISPIWPNSNGISSVFPAAGWFNIAGGVPAAGCGALGAGYKTEETEAVLDDLDEAIIEKRMNYDAFQKEMDWQNEKKLLGRLRAFESLGSSDEGNAFLASKTNSSLEALAMIDEQRERALLADREALNRLSGLNAARYSLNQQLMAADASVTDETDGQQIASWQQAKESLSSQLKLMDAQICDLQKNINAQRLGLVSALTAINASTTASNKPENNLKLLNDIYLNTVAKDITAFTQGQLSDLYYLAYQCPFEGGEAVHRARSLLSLVNDTFYNDDEICSRAIERYNAEKAAGLSSDANEGIRLFTLPNPASSYLEVQSNIENEEKLTANVYDNTGKLVLSQQANLSARMFKLYVHELPVGLYYLKILGSSGNFYSGKFSVQR